MSNYMPRIGEIYGFYSRSSSGIVAGELVKLLGDVAHLRVVCAPPGSKYQAGFVCLMPWGRLKPADELTSKNEQPAPPVDVPSPPSPVANRQKYKGRALVDAFRPKTLSEVRGQPFAVEMMRNYAAAPNPCAFLLYGPTGTGKTSSARALAADLGVLVDDGPYGGLFEIASGEQTAAQVRETMHACQFRPMLGSGWRVLIVNEADCMTQGASYIWLDVLEQIPEQTTVIFTTNDPGKIPQRFADRCIALEFQGNDAIRPALNELAREIWKTTTGCDDCPPVDAFGALKDQSGQMSFRRLLQRMEPYARSGRTPQKTVA